MKISEKELKKIIREELKEQGILSKIGKWFKKTPQPGVTDISAVKPPATQPDTSSSPEEPTQRKLQPPNKSTRDIYGTKEYKEAMSGLFSIISSATFIPDSAAQNIINDIHSLMGSGKFTNLVLKEEEHILKLSDILSKHGVLGNKKIQLMKSINKYIEKNPFFAQIVSNKMSMAPSGTDMPKTKPSPVEMPAKTKPSPVEMPSPSSVRSSELDPTSLLKKAAEAEASGDLLLAKALRDKIENLEENKHNNRWKKLAGLIKG